MGAEFHQCMGHTKHKQKSWMSLIVFICFLLVDLEDRHLCMFRMQFLFRYVSIKSETVERRKKKFDDRKAFFFLLSVNIQYSIIYDTRMFNWLFHNKIRWIYQCVRVENSQIHVENDAKLIRHTFIAITISIHS